MKVVSHTAAQVVAAYGAVDVQAAQWPSLMGSLLGNVNSPEVSLISKVSTMEVRSSCDADPSYITDSCIVYFSGIRFHV